jgi:hypothetical protein
MANKENKIEMQNTLQCEWKKAIFLKIKNRTRITTSEKLN